MDQEKDRWVPSGGAERDQNARSNPRKPGISFFRNKTRLFLTSIGLIAAALFFFVATLTTAAGSNRYNVFVLAFSGLSAFSIVIVSCFFAFAALALLSVLFQFKHQSSAITLSGVAFSILLVAFLLTLSISISTDFSTLFFILAILSALIVLIYNVCYFAAATKGDGGLTRSKLRSIIFVFLALVFEATIFFVPVRYQRSGVGLTSHYKILYNVFSGGRFEQASSSVFLAHLIFVVLTAIFAITQFRYLFQKGNVFQKKIENVLYACAGVTFCFFLLGVFVAFYYKTDSAATTYTLSYIPFIFSATLMLIDAIFNGRYREIKIASGRNGAGYRLMMLGFVVLMTALVILTVFSNIIIAKFEGAYPQNLKVNGYEILTHYKSYGESFQILAFILLVVLVVAALGGLISLLAFFRDSKVFKSVFAVTMALGFLGIAALTAFGVFYGVVQKANVERLTSLFAYYGVPLDEKCKVETDTIFCFLGAVGLSVALFIAKPYSKLILAENERTELKLSEDSSVAFSERRKDADLPAQSAPIPSQSAPIKALAPTPRAKEGGEVSVQGEKEPATHSIAIDQCPPFTFLDEQRGRYEADLADRRQSAFSGASLPALIRFIVDYARNSRLHLSYTPEDIATFVAGLGISRLSILQGMSGTGKTSLPKIFAEAIFGNCEIVEVESSWKDKNELLGYYNEFSKIYTPKKFTQDLYKAKLNPEVVTFVVLDEMNLSRIEYYFSDFLSLMENEEDKREIKLVNIKIANYESGERVSYEMLKDDMTLPIPKNVWFIGTANRDESTFEISDKVYDRANTMNFLRRAKKITSFDPPMRPQYLDTETFIALLRGAIEERSFDLSSCREIARAEEILAPYNLSFGNRIERQIENFVKIYSACFEGRDVTLEAVEKIYLSKVVAKLEFKTVENKEELAVQFEKIGFMKCAEFVRKLNEDL